MRAAIVDGRLTEFGRNILPNFSFENSSAWSLASQWSYQTVADARTGSRVARCVPNGSVGLIAATGASPHPTVAGDVWMFALYARVLAPVDGTFQLALHFNRPSESPLVLFQPVTLPEAVSGWVRFEFQVTTPANATSVYPRPSIRPDATTGIFEVDDFELQKVRSAGL